MTLTISASASFMPMSVRQRVPRQNYLLAIFTMKTPDFIRRTSRASGGAPEQLF
jgi:hypothetical protein